MGIRMLSLLRRLREYGVSRSLYYLYWQLRLMFMRVVKGSYSQLGEDLVIDELVGHKDKGFYVDVGANHPRYCNNTKRFSRRGWKGINVEPDICSFEKLSSDRNNDVNLKVGIGSQPGMMPLFRFRASNMSTFSREEADRWRADGCELSETEEVEVRTLAQVLSEHRPSGPIDVLSVDAQGWEMEVLRGNDWSSFKPVVLCVETGSGQRVGQRNEEIDGFLMKLGYQKAHDNGLNSIYLLSLSADAASRARQTVAEYSRHTASRAYLSLERAVSYHYQMELTLDALEWRDDECQRVLEVGGSNNVLKANLANYFRANHLAHEVVSCDVDPSSSPDVVADVRELPFEDGSFDVAVCCEVLEHIPFKDVPAALRELKRVTGGHVVITTPHTSLYVSLVARSSRTRVKSILLNILEPSFLAFKRGPTAWSHQWEIGYRGHQLAVVRSMMSEAGFTIERDFRNPLFPVHHFFFLKA